MTNVSKSLMVGSSAVFDQATYEPRLGKTFWMSATDITAFVGKARVAETVVGNCTMPIALKFNFDGT